MKIIGVFGGSGSGKSTFSKLLKEELEHAEVISLDPYMHNLVSLHSEEIKKAYHIQGEVEHLMLECMKYATQTWIDIIKKDMELEIQKQIKLFSTHTKIVILDWAFLPFLDCYKNCDITIQIVCNETIKVKRLREKFEKKNKSDLWNNEDLLYRVRTSALDDSKFFPNVTIDNSKSFEELELAIKNSKDLLS